MKIIAILPSIKDVHNLLKTIADKYPQNIASFNLRRNEILLLNGTTIKAYSEGSRTDGLRADVAIGCLAEYITCGSKEKKRIWDIYDLIDYLDSMIF